MWRACRLSCAALALGACGYRPVYGPQLGPVPRDLCVDEVAATAIDEPQLAVTLGAALRARLAAQGWRCVRARALRLRVQLVGLATVATAARGQRAVAEVREVTLTAWLRDERGATLWRSGLLRARGSCALAPDADLVLTEQSRAALAAELAVAAASEIATLVPLVIAPPR